MITQMKKYTFLVFHRDYESFLQQIRDLGVLHITEKATGLADDEQLQQSLQRIDEIKRIIRQGAPDQLIQEKAAIQQRIQDTMKEAQRMHIWGDFSREQLTALTQAGYQLRYYKCAKSSFQEEWGVMVAEQSGSVYFVQVSREGEELIDLSELATPIVLNEKSENDLLKDVEGLNGLLAAAQARIDAWQTTSLPELKAEMEEVRRQIDWRKVNLNTGDIADGALKLLEGFCPIDQEAALNALLKSQDVYYEETDPTEEDKTPIKLRNNKFFQMFECLTGMYGWPNYNEFDPTPILGPFFLLFFAFCMGDSGYGLVLTLVGILIAKGKLKIDMFDGLGPIITALGVGTTVIGFFLGTFFGMNLAELIPSMSGIFLNGKFMDTNFDFQMVLALGIGIFHICLAMVIKAICYTKQSGFANNLGTWGWTLLIVGGVLALSIGMLMALPMETITLILIIIGGISAIGIFFLNDIHRNPVLNVFSGLLATYNTASGLLGDVLSYVRLYALGLAGGMLGAAFNTLGLMTKEAPLGWIWFILIVVIGHTLNLALASLGAFVHPLRLSFVEYFKNVGYEGKGKKYEPFKK